MNAALWAEIHRLHDVERLSLRAIERRLHCGRRLIRKALAQSEPPAGKATASSHSILDPYKGRIKALIDHQSELTAVRVLEEIGKEGYSGEVTLVRNHLRRIRPRAGRVYQEVDYAPGSAMQVDWGECGRITIDTTVRRVSVFVAVLCHSRLLYIKFTLSQTKEEFYRAIVAALTFFGASPESIIVDNLKAAVIEGYGRQARFHPEFAALCGHYRMRPIACDRADPESKGTVEAAVRYVKRNALLGRHEELESFEDYRSLAISWRDKVANVRLHATTKERPLDRFQRERQALRPLPPFPYDTDEIRHVVVTPFARVRFDGNRYSVPTRFHRKPVTLRADDTHLRVIYDGEEIASHCRSHQRGRTIIDPAHSRDTLARRKRFQARQIEIDFDALGPEARAFRIGLAAAPLKPTVHLRRLLELVTLYGKAEVLAAVARALEYQTFDAAYVQNLIDQERRRRHAPSPLPLTPKRRELLDDIHLEESDPACYDCLLGSDGDNRHNDNQE